MYSGVLYFAGSKSRWSGRIDESEVIARVSAPWRWLARRLTLSLFRQLDDGKCGYALMDGGACIEQFDPEIR